MPLTQIRPVGGITRARALEIAIAALGGGVVPPADDDVPIRKPLDQDMIDDKLRAYIGNAGLTMNAAARKIGIGHDTATRRCKELGIVPLNRRGHSSHAGMTEAEHERIRNAIADMHADGLTDTAMGETLGLSTVAVRKRRERLGLPLNKVSGKARYEDRVYGHESKRLNQRIVELHGDGLDDRQIAAELDKPHNGIKRRRIALGLPSHHPSGHPVNEQKRDLLQSLVDEGLTKYGIPCNPASPSSHRDREVVAALVAEGLSNYQIGRRLGVDKTTIARWIVHHGLTR
jgi:transposase